MAKKNPSTKTPAPVPQIPVQETNGTETNGTDRKKTVCEITLAQFREHALPLDVTIDGKSFEVETKEFSTGSFGWYLNGKITLTIDGVRVPVQMGLNLTVVGSKELK